MMRIINAGDRVMNTWIYEIPDGYVIIDTGYPGKLKSVEKKDEAAWSPMVGYPLPVSDPCPRRSRGVPE